jgi:hypothetical protein
MEAPLMDVEYTVKEFAFRERVTERTVYNWMTKGAVQFRRTPGGGIRIIDRRDGSGARIAFYGMKPSETTGNPSA